MLLSVLAASIALAPAKNVLILGASGPSAERGTLSPAPEIVAVAVTALAHLGVPTEWDLDGRVRGVRP